MLQTFIICQLSANSNCPLTNVARFKGRHWLIFSKFVQHKLLSTCYQPVSVSRKKNVRPALLVPRKNQLPYHLILRELDSAHFAGWISALAATYWPWATPSLAISCGALAWDSDTMTDSLLHVYPCCVGSANKYQLTWRGAIEIAWMSEWMNKFSLPSFAILACLPINNSLRWTNFKNQHSLFEACK